MPIPLSCIRTTASSPAAVTLIPIVLLCCLYFAVLECGDPAFQRLDLRFLVRAIPYDLGEPEQLALLVPERRQRAADPDPAAVLADLPAVVLGFPGAAGGPLLPGRQVFFKVFG